MSDRKTILSVVADRDGQVFEHPDLFMAGMNGMSAREPYSGELIPLPEGSRLFVIPRTPPLGLDRRTGRMTAVDRLPRRWGGGEVQAVSAFLVPGYTRTLLPAADYRKKKISLPLWAYTAVGWCVEEERFYAAALRVDENTQWQPENYDDRQLDPLVRRKLVENPENRLLEQLARCALDYHCFAAKNLFYGRWEAPLPTSPACNSRCLGCISLQESDCCPSSQERLDFIPTVKEICEIAVPHLKRAENAIVSFGQGCEGDPILQADLACSAVRRMREQTSRGTINFNSNASIPDAVNRLAEAGTDSMRISLNSAQKSLYQSYYRPRGYAFEDVMESIRRSRKSGMFTMLNYLVFPGITDHPDEVDALSRLIEVTGADMIQMRNLSIDPSFYWDNMKVRGEGMGMTRMMDLLKERFPHLQYGYFNRTADNFYPNSKDKEGK